MVKKVKKQDMRREVLYLSVLLVLLGLGACKTTKDLVYLRDVEGNEVQVSDTMVVPEYKIKTNDNLYVTIQSLDPEVNQLFMPSQGMNSTGGTQQMFGTQSAQYLNGYLVNNAGKITLPILGDVGVAGLTAGEAQGVIQKKSNEYLKNATVKVKLLSYKVTVMGEVKNPGVYYNYNNSLTVLEAVSMANGITDYARINKVLVLRNTAKGSTTYRLDLSSKKLLSSKAFFLQPNDVVYVEPDKYKNVKLNSPLYALMLSSITTLIVLLKYIAG